MGVYFRFLKDLKQCIILRERFGMGQATLDTTTHMNISPNDLLIFRTPEYPFFDSFYTFPIVLLILVPLYLRLNTSQTKGMAAVREEYRESISGFGVDFLAQRAFDLFDVHHLHLQLMLIKF